jgi:hypothetical protein
MTWYKIKKHDFRIFGFKVNKPKIITAEIFPKPKIPLVFFKVGHRTQIHVRQ